MNQITLNPDGHYNELLFCDHPALTGTDDLGVNKCDGCGVLIRDIPDPDGNCTAMDFKTKEITRFRQEIVTHSGNQASEETQSGFVSSDVR